LHLEYILSWPQPLPCGSRTLSSFSKYAAAATCVPRPVGQYPSPAVPRPVGQFPAASCRNGFSLSMLYFFARAPSECMRLFDAWCSRLNVCGCEICISPASWYSSFHCLGFANSVKGDYIISRYAVIELLIASFLPASKANLSTYTGSYNSPYFVSASFALNIYTGMSTYLNILDHILMNLYIVSLTHQCANIEGTSCNPGQAKV
jgi:hypothetical protein